MAAAQLRFCTRHGRFASLISAPKSRTTTPHTARPAGWPFCLVRHVGETQTRNSGGRLAHEYMIPFRSIAIVPTMGKIITEY